MTKIYDKYGGDTGLDWDDAPEWANFLITNYASCVWAEGWNTGTKVKAETATGGYSFDTVCYSDYHHWVLISERPKEQEWEVGDELEFLGGKQYFHTGFFVKGETYTVRDILDTGYNLKRGGYSVFWANSTIKECFKNLTKQRLTKEENMRAEATLLPVKDINHLEELMNKGNEVYFNDEKVISFMRKPAGSATSYQWAVFTDTTQRTGLYVGDFKYKATKVRRQYQTGDKAEDIVSILNNAVVVYSLFDFKDGCSTPLALKYSRKGEVDTYATTFGYANVVVEVEE